MFYLLDTNVLSEFVRVAPEARVVEWVTAQSPIDLFVSALTLGEMEKGIESMPSGARRTRFEEWARIQVPRQFRDRVLPVDAPVAVAWGRLVAEARRAGRPLPAIDGLLVASAQVHGLTLVTRNVGDCAGRGVPVLDLWTNTLHP